MPGKRKKVSKAPTVVEPVPKKLKLIRKSDEPVKKQVGCISI